MDGSSKRAGKHASDAVTATVVRQFAPSRIERQLLAQAFEMLWGLPSEKLQSGLVASRTGTAHGVGDVEQALDSQIVQGGA